MLTPLNSIQHCVAFKTLEECAKLTRNPLLKITFPILSIEDPIEEIHRRAANPVSPEAFRHIVIKQWDSSGKILRVSQKYQEPGRWQGSCDGVAIGGTGAPIKIQELLDALPYSEMSFPSSDLYATEVLLIGPGESGEELMSLIDRYPTIKIIHVVDVSEYVFEAIESKLAMRDAERSVVFGYRTNAINLPPALYHSCDLALDTTVFDPVYFNSAQLNAAALSIAKVLKLGGVHISMMHPISLEGLPPLRRVPILGRSEYFLLVHLKTKHSASWNAIAEKMQKSVDGLIYSTPFGEDYRIACSEDSVIAMLTSLAKELQGEVRMVHAYHKDSARLEISVSGDWAGKDFNDLKKFQRSDMLPDRLMKSWIPLDISGGTIVVDLLGVENNFELGKLALWGKLSPALQEFYRTDLIEYELWNLTQAKQLIHAALENPNQLKRMIERYRQESDRRGISSTKSLFAKGLEAEPDDVERLVHRSIGHVIKAA